MIRRREFITLLGGAAAAWPRVGRAQTDRVRLIGMLMAAAADDPEYQARIGAFQHGLALLGWTDGRNARIDTRWAINADDIRRHAAELAALAPGIILAGTGTTTVAPLLQSTRVVPIVFVIVIDPVGAGFVASLARPGGNAFRALDGCVPCSEYFCARAIAAQLQARPAPTRPHPCRSDLPCHPSGA